MLPRFQELSWIGVRNPRQLLPQPVQRALGRIHLSPQHCRLAGLPLLFLEERSLVVAIG